VRIVSAAGYLSPVTSSVMSRRPRDDEAGVMTSTGDELVTSLLIGCLLFIPVTVILCATVVIRLRTGMPSSVYAYYRATPCQARYMPSSCVCVCVSVCVCVCHTPELYHKWLCYGRGTTRRACQ